MNPQVRPPSKAVSSSSARIEQLIDLIDELIEVVIEENEWLAQGLPASRSKQIARKIELADVLKQWTDEIQEKIETKRSEMQWYTVQHFSSVSGIKYIKEEWLFKNGPIVVVMNSHGTVENPNALNMITLSGMKALLEYTVVN